MSIFSTSVTTTDTTNGVALTTTLSDPGVSGSVGVRITSGNGKIGGGTPTFPISSTDGLVVFDVRAADVLRLAAVSGTVTADVIRVGFDS